MDNSSFAIVPFVQDHLLVIIALGLCATLAVLVLAGMAWGAKLKRARTHAEHEEAARIDAMEAQGVFSTEPTEAQRAAGVPAPSSDEPAGQADKLAEVHPRPGSPPKATAPSHGHDEGPSSERLDDEPIAAGEPVTRLKGLGPKIAARLAELGITTVDQIAALDDAQADALDAELGAFRGRMARDQWREQARLLAAGDRAGYEAVYGKLG